MTKIQRKHSISVIVCTYNGERTIGRCLQSLIQQTYPKDRFEIIVVNDGSRDNVKKQINRFSVVLINHKTNLGIPSARNTGLNHAKGDIVAYIDDDCIADKNWLAQLNEGYNDENVMGVGGITLPISQKTIIEKYMFESGYGLPAPLAFGKSKNPLYRFIVYIKDKMNPILNNKGIFAVQDIYGANASFRKRYLKKINGYDQTLYTSEDTDICTRLHEKFKDKNLICISHAIVYHKHQTSYIKSVKQTFFRSENLLHYYMKHKIFPPVYPFPMLILSFTLLGIFKGWFISLLIFLITTQLLYFWWFTKLIKQKNILFFIFSYIQFSIEFTELLGITISGIKYKLKV